MFREAYDFDCLIYEDLALTGALPRELENVLVNSIEDYIAFGYRGKWLDPTDLDSEKNAYG